MDSVASCSKDDVLLIKREEIYRILRSDSLSNLDERLNSVIDDIIQRTHCPENKTKDIKLIISAFKFQFKKRWECSQRTEERFLNNNKPWLEEKLQFHLYKHQSNKPVGRPVTDFDECTDRSKRKKTEEIRSLTPISELCFATQMALRAAGKNEAAKIVREVTSPHSEIATTYKTAYVSYTQAKDRMLNQEDALAFLVDAELSKHQYGLVRKADPQRFPSYKCIQTAKNLCFPDKGHITITEKCAVVELQPLLDHTVKRIIKLQEPVLATLSAEEIRNLTLVTKWGFDGSSGHSAYKQAFQSPEASDSAVFITSLVPLRLHCNSTIVWQNPRPSSTRFCRPIKIEFLKESVEVSVAEKSRVDNEIQNLTATSSLVDDKLAVVKHELLFSMVDGKVCNALTENTNTQKCYLCGATSKDFNSIDVVIAKPVKTENLQFGLSSLHGWIRFFEGILHLAYKLPIKKWRAQKEDKKMVEERKKEIQKQFKEKCGLIVDVPKTGFGNSNDGNTARRFFANPKVSAEITGVDFDLIQRLRVVLVAISSGHDIDVDKFRNYAVDTAKYYVQLYPWYPMSPTMHKFLIHGPEIIASAMLPIDQLTEEAQEARNKDFKRYREHHSRKCSRQKSNEDILKWFLLSSDPILSSKRSLPKQKLRCLPGDVLSLLKTPDIQPRSNESSASSSSESEEED